MLLYVLICLSLALAGVAGLELMYLFYLNRIDEERKKRIIELERQCRRLIRRVTEAEHEIAEQRRLIESIDPGFEDEVWADVIDER
ncbi:MAG: hypothetical protein ABR535_05940 [Pyrinomonadaceae bacterium]